MNRSEAAELINQLESASRELDKAVELAEKIDDEEIRESLRRSLAQAIGTVVADTILPIAQLFPELNPYSKDKL